MRAYPGDHGQSQEEHQDGHAEGELLPVRLQHLGPVVHQAGHERLHPAELRVDTQGEQHDEEQEGPQGRRGDGQDHLGVDQEGQAGTGLDNIIDQHTFGVSHVAQDGEDHHGGEE